MEYLIGFLVFAAIAYAIALRVFPHTVTWKEVLIGIVVQCAVIATVFYSGIYSKGYDVQILNGYVTEKFKDRVSCEHSYSCNCTTVCSGTGSSRSCSRVCQTCYEHPRDYDWVVRSTVGSLLIPRVDRQGAEEPPRFSKVEVGEFFAKESSYFNYIKASPLTIFDKNLIENPIQTPSYISVHDHYRINRVINFGSAFVGDFNDLNNNLNESLKTLGGEKKVNVVVLFHKGTNAFIETVRAKLYGGKINDVVVAIKASQSGEVEAVDVFSWSKNDLANVKIRDSVLDMKVLDDMKLLSDNITNTIRKEYQPRSIEEFQYLKANIEPAAGVIWFLWVFGLAFPFIWGYIAHKHLDVY